LLTVRSLIARFELLDVSLLNRSFAIAPQKQKSPRRESWATDDRVAESGKKTRRSNPPAHGGDNTYRRKNEVERREASERGSNETSKSGYAAGSGVSIAGRGWFFWGGGLQEIPLVAIEVFEDGDGAVSLLARSLEETDAAGLIGFVVAPEVVGVEKEEYAAAGLIADGEGLLRSCGFCQEKSGAVGTGRSDEEPALVAGERSVLKQAEAEFLGEELDGFIVIANNESQVRDGLGHGSGLWHLHDVECVEDRISHRGHRGIAQMARRIRKVFRGK